MFHADTVFVEYFRNLQIIRDSILALRSIADLTRQADGCSPAIYHYKYAAPAALELLPSFIRQCF